MQGEKGALGATGKPGLFGRYGRPVSHCDSGSIVYKNSIARAFLVQKEKGAIKGLLEK